MKKKLSLLLAIALICVFSLTGCGNDTLTMATGGTSGTYYGYCGIIAQNLQEDVPVTVVSTGASKANLQMLQAGEAQLAIVQNDVMSYAYTGTDLFEQDGEYKDFSTVMACYPETVQVIANKKITSIADLKGKKVSVGDAGSGVEFNARQVLAAYGIDMEKDIVKNNQSFADSADSLKNGTIDAAFVVAGAPTVAVTELASSYDFNVLPIDSDAAAKLMKDYGFYTEVVVPGGTYKCVKDDVTTVAVMATIVARNDVPEDTIYTFVKGMFDKKDQIAAGHEKGQLIDLNTAVSGVTVPFHPGAEKYFKEQGVL